MLGKKPKILEKANLIGKMVVFGCIAGAAIKGISSKRIEYGTFFATKLAVIGSVFYAGSKAIKSIVNKK